MADSSTRKPPLRASRSEQLAARIARADAKWKLALARAQLRVERTARVLAPLRGTDAARTCTHERTAPSREVPAALVCPDCGALLFRRRGGRTP